MPELLTLAHWEFYTVLLSLLLLIALKRWAARFGDDTYDLCKRGLQRLWHWLRPVPVLAAAPPAATAAPSVIASTPTVLPPANETYTSATTITTMPALPPVRYQDFEPLSAGDIAQLYRARQVSPSQMPVIVKLAGELADNAWLQHEATALHTLAGNAAQYAKHLPTLLDQFRMDDGRLANVLAPCEGYDLHALRQHFTQGLDAQHVFWIFRRALSVLGYAHSQGILHGNIEPAHIIVRPQDHNVWLVDWCYAVLRPKETGMGFRALNAGYSAPEVAERKAPLPAADLYSLGLTMLYLLGGDPAQQQIPPQTPEPLARLLRFLLRPSAIQRPQEAWVLYHELEVMREKIYGPHQFLELRVGVGR